jgi:MFS family permease
MSAALSMGFLKRQRKVLAREPVTLASIFSGVSFIWDRSAVLGVISLDLFAVLLGGVTALLPIYARDILHAGPWGLGLLRSAPAIGAVITSVFLSQTSLGAHVGLKMFAAVIAFGAATIVFSLSANLALSIGALLLVGASDTISVVIRMSMIQLFTPDAMRGRVNAVNSLFIGTSNQLGEFESGIVAGLLGPVAAGVTGGLGTIVIALIWMWRFPGLRKLSRLADQNA